MNLLEILHSTNTKATTKTHLFFRILKAKVISIIIQPLRQCGTQGQSKVKNGGCCYSIKGLTLNISISVLMVSFISTNVVP